MKKINNIFSILLVAVCMTALFTACASDEGNYDYTQSNDLTISGLESSYTVEQFTSLSIHPNITGTQGFDSSNYDYVWYIYQVNGNGDIDTLSTEKDLDAEINLSPKDYDLIFQVKDKQTGVFYMQRTDVTVVNSYSNGLIILSNVDGYGNVAFVNSIDKVTENVFESVNGYKLGRNAVGAFYTGGDEVQRMVVITTDDGSVATDPIDFHEMFPFSEMFYFPMTPGRMTCLCRSEWGFNEHIIVDGYTFNRYISFVDTPFQKYGARVGGDYELAPFSFYEDNDPYFYDQKGKRFMYYNYSDLQPVLDADSPLFNPANMGMTMLWGRNFGVSGESHVRAVMQDASGNRFFIGGTKDVGYDMTTWESFYRLLPTHKQELTQEGAAQATTFAIGNNEPNFLYYAYGNKIACVSINTGNVIATYTLPQNIDYMEFNYYDNPEQLYVAVSDGSGSAKSGSVYVLEAASDGTLSEVKNYKNICGKVVDFEYK